VIDGKIQLKYASAAKRSDMNKDKKNLKTIMRCRDSRSAKNHRNKIGMIA